MRIPAASAIGTAVFNARPLHLLDLVALDLEATGVAHGHDRICEVGAARFRVDREGRVIPGDTFDALVDPQLKIPEIVSRLTGIDDALVQGAPTLDGVWGDLLSFLGEAPETVVIAHSARSDLAYLVSEATRLGLPLPPVPFACTLEISRRALPGARRFGLGALRAHTGGADLDGATYHRALADALHTRNLFGHCVRSQAAQTLGDLGVRRPVDWPDPDEFVVDVPPRLEPLFPAIQERERVTIIYRGGSKGRHERPVTPLAFFAFRGVPHLRAWCHLDDAAKTFRCDRIARVTAPG